MNRHLYVTTAAEFGIQEINIYENDRNPADVSLAEAEHTAFLTVQREIGTQINQLSESPVGAKDFVYAANQFFCLDGIAVLAHLPVGRELEVPFMTPYLNKLVIKSLPAPHLFSGQGDTLFVPPTTKRAGFIFMGYGHRTDPQMAEVLRRTYNVTVYPIKARTKRTWWGGRSRNRVTGLWNSYWYDLDIAVGVIDEQTVAVCLGALTRRSRKQIIGACHEQGVEIIPVSIAESRDGFGCNLVSNGTAVVMSDGAPRLSAELERRGKVVHRLHNSELKKGGGGYRCISTALDNRSSISEPS